MSILIRLFGGLAVELAGRDATPRLPGRQGRILLAYLALNHGRSPARDELIEALWENGLPNAPDSALSSLLTGLRRALGPGALAGRSHVSLSLPPDAIDLEVARRAAAAAESALAAAQYGDALASARLALATLSTPLLPEFDGAWLRRPRAEIEQLNVEQLEIAARAALLVTPPELSAAERLAHELTVREPYRESGYALRMEALAAAGNVAEALRVFESLRVLLRDEMGATPAASLTALHDRLLIHGARSAPAAPTAAAAVPMPVLLSRSERRPFVGRDAELARLRERWTQAAGGDGGLVLLTGDAGAGKTRLAARLAGEVHARGAVVLSGRADEETVVPYQPFVEIMRHYVAGIDLPALRAALGRQLDELRPLLPELAQDAHRPADGEAPDAEGRRYALFEAISALSRHAAGERPLLVVLEDLHWADKPTLLLLRQIVREAEGCRVLVLGTYRDVELGAAAPLTRVLADLRREQLVVRIALGGLGREETAELLAARGAEAALANRIWEYTAGNPFFIEETVRSMAEEDAPTQTLPVPESVQDLIMRRLERLGAPTSGTLTYAAVLGHDFSLPALERVAREPVDVVLDAVDALRGAGLVVEHAERVDHFSFSHALVRATVYSRIAPSRRRRMHLRTGGALESLQDRTSVAPAELAHHFFVARHVGGASQAVEWAIEAASAARAAHAYEEAAVQYERALTALEELAGEDERRIELLLALGAVRWQGGEPGARRAYERAAELARRCGATAPLARAALGMGGRFYVPEPMDAAYVGLLEEALRGTEDEALRAHLLGRIAESRSAEADAAPSIRLGLDAVAAARRSAESTALVAALLARHATLLHVEHLEARREAAEDAVALADDQGLRELGALARHWLIYDLVEAAEVDAAFERHAELERAAHELHQPLYRHSALAWRGVCAQVAGRFDEAERLAREGLRMAQRAGSPTAHANFIGQLLVARREQNRLPELLPEVQRLAEEGSRVLPWPALLPLLYAHAGERERAGEALASAMASPPPHRLFWLTASAWLAEAAAVLRDPSASPLHDRLSPYADRLVQASFTGCWGSVRRTLDLLTAATSRPHDASGLASAER